MILSTKKNHQQSKKNIPQQKICKIVGLSLYTLMQHQKSKSEFAKFKTKKYSKKFFACYIYKQSPLPKKKKNVQQIAPSTFEKKQNIPPWKKKDSKKKLTYFHLCFFVSFFFCQITILQNKNIFWCRVETKTCSKLNKFPYLFPPILFLFLEFASIDYYF